MIQVWNIWKKKYSILIYARILLILINQIIYKTCETIQNLSLNLECNANFWSMLFHNFCDIKVLNVTWIDKKKKLIYT